MTIFWGVLTAVITSFITTLVCNFFLQRMAENARKPRRTEHHRRIIEYLSSPNVVARVQLPNGSDQLYEVEIMPIKYRMAGGIQDQQLEAFDEMVEQKIVIPVKEHLYRLSRNFRDKYRKPVLTLAYEEFGLKSIVGLLQKLFPFRKSSNPGSNGGLAH